ncbi:MAG: hypothetical protein J5505_07125 [Spirochaetaceae bacterium]|nr:hypothetical protein [Spirochaetaceae bacterium]
MIFFLLNVLLIAGIIFFSLYVDLDEKETKSKALTNLVLSLAVEVIFVLFVFLSLFAKNPQLVNLTGKLMLFGYALFGVSFLIFVIQYPKFEPRKILTVFRYVLLAIALVLVWEFGTISLSATERLSVAESMSPILGFDWYTLY